MSGEAKRVEEYRTIRCEHPNIIYNPYHIQLLQTHRTYTIRNRVYHLPADYDFENIYRDISFRKNNIDTLDDIDTCNIVNSDTGEIYPLYMLVPCRKCKLCKDIQVSEWCTRAQMECSTSCSVPFFVTLTYNDDNLPEDMSVHKEELQNFMKRLRIHYDRKNTSHSIRYAGCGEYGAKYGRPHYHLILWNLPNVYTHIEFIEVLQQLWTNGFVQCKPANSNAIGYVMKYIKKDGNVPTFINKHGETQKCEKPFFLASRNKALGLQYLQDNWRFLVNNPSLSFEVLDPYSGNIKKCSLPQYLISKLYPLVSSLVPQFVRSAYNNVCQIWKYFENCGYPLQDFRYNIVRDKFSFLPSYNPSDKILEADFADMARILNLAIDVCLVYQFPDNFFEQLNKTLEYKTMLRKYASEHPFTFENLSSLSHKSNTALLRAELAELNNDAPF